MRTIWQTRLSTGCGRLSGPGLVLLLAATVLASEDVPPPVAPTVLQTYGGLPFYVGDDVSEALYTPDGQRLLTATSSRIHPGKSILWSAAGERLRELPFSTLVGQFTPDGREFYHAAGRRLTAYDTADWQPRRQAELPFEAVALALVGARGLAVVGPTNLVVLDRQTLDAQVPRALGEAIATVFAPDGTLLARATRPNEDQTVFTVIETLTGAVRASFPRPSSDSPWGRPLLALSRDGRRLAAADYYDLWLGDLATGTLTELPSPPVTESRFIMSDNVKVSYLPDDWTGLAFNPAGDVLVALKRQIGKAHVYDVAAAKLQQSVQLEGARGATGVVFRPDGRELTMLGESLGLVVAAYHFPELQAVRDSPGYDGTPGVYFHPSGEFFIQAAERGRLRAFNAATGQVRSESPPNFSRGGWDDAVLLARVPVLAANDSRENSEVRILDTTTWQPVKVLKEHAAYLQSLALDEASSVLYSGDRAGIIYAWDVTTWQRQARFSLSLQRGHGVFALAVNRDLLVAGTSAGTVEIFKRATPEAPPVVLPVPSRPEDPGGYYVIAVAFAPDGARFAALSSDGSIYVFASGTLQPETTLQSRSSNQRVAFAPDGAHLVVTSNDGLEVWHVPSGRLLAEERGERLGRVGDLRFAGGRLLFTVGGEAYRARRVAVPTPFAPAP